MIMKIGIDARLIRETGVGRYIRNLICQLASTDKQNTYILFLTKKDYDRFPSPGKNFLKVKADIPWHSIREQLEMPGLIAKQKLDLIHIPYFNITVLYSGKMIVTIHDLTILHFATGKATTLPVPIYEIKRLAYRLILAIGLRKAVKIITPSLTTKKEIIDHYAISENKITVTYEGVDDSIAKNNTQNAKPFIGFPYFLYVGNAYPHKNLERLLEAFNMFTVHGSGVVKNIKLVLVGKEDYFYRRLIDIVHKEKLEKQVIFFGEANDRQLVNLYRNAIALVFPSLMEGFGLPALEAVSCGRPVIVSDIPVFHEILGKSALFINPISVENLYEKMLQIVQQPHVKPNPVNMDRFSWTLLAKVTLDIYEHCVRL